jgi:hypothetical protein
MQNCITRGHREGRLRQEPRRQACRELQVKNFKMSGNSATYTMDVQGRHDMTADVAIPSARQLQDGHEDGDEPGRPHEMNQSMEGRYLGPCNK